MDHGISYLEGKARTNPAFTRPLCWLLHVRSLLLEGRVLSCEEEMAVYKGLPSRETVSSFVHQPLRVILSDTGRYLLSLVKARLREARATLALEIGVVFYGWNCVVQSIVLGGGYTKGWAILGVGITQPEYGWVLAVECLFRSLAILFGHPVARYRLAWSDLLIQGTTLYCVAVANPTSPALSALFMVCMADLWIIGNNVWAKVVGDS